MAPKQPDWAFLESLAPDDLEEDDTEKVNITATTSTKISVISIAIFLTMITNTGCPRKKCVLEIFSMYEQLAVL